MTPKFRAWLIEAKRMVDIDGITFRDGEIHSIRYDNRNSSLYEGIGFNLMQSTGVKDRNGTEIYEGDVVIPDGGGASLVHWKDGAFQVGYYGDIPYVLADYKSLTVIGNIYENPELKKELIDVIDD